MPRLNVVRAQEKGLGMREFITLFFVFALILTVVAAPAGGSSPAQ